MSEIKPIIDAYAKISSLNVRMALATVVRVRGSAYRTPGARMFILEDGRWFGSVSGGCLEGDVLRRARKVMEDHIPQVITYDTADEENSTLAINLGCNGVIDILLEAVDKQEDNNPVALLEKLIDDNKNSVVATIIAGPSQSIGRKFVLGDFHGYSEAFIDQLAADCMEVINSRKSQVRSYLSGDQLVEVFIEFVAPPIRLAIFGAGYDARPLSRFAHELGWTVTVTDECAAHIAPVFFPSADNLSMCQREFIDIKVDVTERTACVLISHNYDYDLAVLSKLLSTSAPYIGIVGPRKRFGRMLDDLGKQGIVLASNDLERIHSPIGLDIGAEAPAEIAISILGEVMAKFSARSAAFLKSRNTPIHERTSTNEVLKAQL